MSESPAAQLNKEDEVIDGHFRPEEGASGGSPEVEDTALQTYRLDDEEKPDDFSYEQEPDKIDDFPHEQEPDKIDDIHHVEHFAGIPKESSLKLVWQSLRAWSKQVRRKLRYHVFFFLISIASSVSLLLRLTVTESSKFWLSPFFFSDVASAFLFTLDVLIGVIAHGFCSHRESYFRMNLYNKVRTRSFSSSLCSSSLSQIDTIVAILIWPEVALRIFGFRMSFRTLKIFRIFFIISRTRALKRVQNIVTSLAQATASLTATTFLLVVGLLAFAVVRREMCFVPTLSDDPGSGTTDGSGVIHGICQQVLLLVGHGGHGCSSDKLQNFWRSLEIELTSAESSGHISFDDALLGFVTVFQVASMDSAYAVIHTFLQSEPSFKLLTWLFFIAINALFSIIAFNM
eukprot:129053-Hanusia_phi.AAC.2